RLVENLPDTSFQIFERKISNELGMLINIYPYFEEKIKLLNNAGRVVTAYGLIIIKILMICSYTKKVKPINCDPYQKKLTS
ncbi:MAG TPA: hypothetical protein VGZ71_02925, partial [Puia sp.]|nr:hypothetical protein [Puia sp.]